MSADPSSAPPRPRRRTGPVLGAGAALLALWLGLSAPAVSPVAPAAAPSVAQSVTSTDQGGGQVTDREQERGLGGLADLPQLPDGGRAGHRR